MRTLSYVSGATGERIGFEGPLYGETLTGLRASGTTASPHVA